MPAEKGKTKRLEKENEDLIVTNTRLLETITELRDLLVLASPLDWMREPEVNIQAAFRWEKEAKKLLSEKEDKE